MVEKNLERTRLYYGQIVSGGCEMDQSIVAQWTAAARPSEASRVRLCPRRDTCTSSIDGRPDSRLTAGEHNASTLVCGGGQGMGLVGRWTRWPMPVTGPRVAGQQRGCDRRVAGASYKRPMTGDAACRDDAQHRLQVPSTAVLIGHVLLSDGVYHAGAIWNNCSAVLLSLT